MTKPTVHSIIPCATSLRRYGKSEYLLLLLVERFVSVGGEKHLSLDEHSAFLLHWTDTFKWFAQNSLFKGKIERF